MNTLIRMVWSPIHMGSCPVSAATALFLLVGLFAVPNDLVAQSKTLKVIAVSARDYRGGESETDSLVEGTFVSFLIHRCNGQDSVSPSATCDDDQENVNLTVTETGSMVDGHLGGTGTYPTSVEFRARDIVRVVTLSTKDDDTDEANSTITLTVTATSGFTIGSPSSKSITILDNDTANAPKRPKFSAIPSDGQVTLKWEDPADTGASPISGYQYRYRYAGYGWRDWVDIPRSDIIRAFCKTVESGELLRARG